MHKRNNDVDEKLCERQKKDVTTTMTEYIEPCLITNSCFVFLQYIFKAPVYPLHADEQVQQEGRLFAGTITISSQVSNHNQQQTCTGKWKGSSKGN